MTKAKSRYIILGALGSEKEAAIAGPYSTKAGADEECQYLKGVGYYPRTDKIYATSWSHALKYAHKGDVDDMLRSIREHSAERVRLDDLWYPLMSIG